MCTIPVLKIHIGTYKLREKFKWWKPWEGKSALRIINRRLVSYRVWRVRKGRRTREKQFSLGLKPKGNVTYQPGGAKPVFPLFSWARKVGPLCSRTYIRNPLLLNSPSYSSTDYRNTLLKDKLFFSKGLAIEGYQGFSPLPFPPGPSDPLPVNRDQNFTH